MRGHAAPVLCTLPAFFADGFGGLLGLFPSLASDIAQVHIVVCFLLWALVVTSEYAGTPGCPLETFKKKIN